MTTKELYSDAVELLRELIHTPSFSGEEDKVAGLILQWLQKYGVECKRTGNNVWAVNKHFDPAKPSVLLNSHHDTVLPDKAYTNDPFDPKIAGGKLFGLGSNDAGGCVVSLMALFVHYYDHPDLKYNLILAIAGEEESSGSEGLLLLLKELPPIDFAVVGEPTEMQMAVAERGLLVVDGYAHGVTGHAAHDNTDNAIYNAIEDINWIRNYTFSKTSELLGKVKMSVTQIDAGQQHNTVPALCHFVIDIRVNERYSNEEVFEILDAHTKGTMKPRSFRLGTSSIPVGHPIVQAGLHLGRKTYGSPTLSDQALLKCPSLKMGPGCSARSHSADEFIFLEEIEKGIELYIKMFNEII